MERVRERYSERVCGGRECERDREREDERQRDIKRRREPGRERVREC